MADSKITALASIGTGTDPANDPLVIVDVSDVSPGGMSATGTTKKVTLNNLLACSPTATLASATITGDLTARNWFVTGGSIPGVGNGNPFAYRIGGGGLGIGAATETGTTAPIVFYCGAGGVEQYRIAPLGVNTWSDGAGGTRMTLNATGLGIGGGPASTYKFQSTQTVSSYGGWFLAGLFTSPTATMVRLSCSTPNLVSSIANDGDGGFKILTNGTLTTVGSESLVVTPTGNVGIGVTPVTGGKLTVAGPIVRNKGSNTLTQNVATTVATLPGEGLFIAYAYTNASNPSAFTSYAVILCDSVGSRIIANNGTQITITTSTFALQVTQAFAATLNVVWSFVQIG